MWVLLSPLKGDGCAKTGMVMPWVWDRHGGREVVAGGSPSKGIHVRQVEAEVLEEDALGRALG